MGLSEAAQMGGAASMTAAGGIAPAYRHSLTVIECGFHALMLVVTDDDAVVRLDSHFHINLSLQVSYQSAGQLSVYACGKSLHLLAAALAQQCTASARTFPMPFLMTD